jgi:hypothetical protein
MQADADLGSTESSLVVCLNARGGQRWGTRIAQAHIVSVRPLPDDRSPLLGL